MLQAQSLRLRARKKSGDLTTAIVPAGTCFPAVLREPCDLVCSLRGNLLLRPVKLGSVDPHAVQNDCELARDGDCGLSQPISLGEPQPPSLQRRPFRHAGQQHAGCFEKITAEHGVTTLRDASRPVNLAGSMASGRQSDISANTS